MFIAVIYSNEGLRSAMRFNFEATAPVALDFCPGDIAPLNQTIKIFDFYVGSSELDENTADSVTAVSEGVLVSPCDRGTRSGTCVTV